MTRETDRTRRHTARSVLESIDERTRESLTKCSDSSHSEIAARLDHLDREWDIDRTLEAEASFMALTGLALGATVDRRFYALSGFVASMVLLQSVTGWYPLLPLFRRLGVRTAREINRERYALKALRGDFDNLDGLPSDDAAALLGGGSKTDSLRMDGKPRQTPVSAGVGGDRP